MDSETLGLLIAGIAGVVIAVPKIVDTFRGRPSRRDAIGKDVEILSSLTEESESRESLAKFIDAEIERLIEDEQHKRLEPTGAVLAIFLIGLSLWLIVTISFGNVSAWLLLVAIPLMLTGLVGFVQDAVPRRRDERGRPIRDDN